MTTSYNGWAASPDPAAIGIDPGFTASGIRFPGGVKAGDVSTVFADLVAHLVVIDPPASTDYAVEGFWGYSWKQSANSPNLVSCHASGTAIDWRAVAHPNGSGPWYGYTSSAAQQIRELLGGRYQGLVANLSDQATPDPMHYEIAGTPSQIAQLAATLSGGGGSSGGDADMALSDADVERVAQAVMTHLRTDPVVRMTTIDQATGAESVADVSATRSWQSAQTQAARAAYRSR